MKWITRERPKIDRLACPWLIKRFIDEKAEIIYVPFDQVLKESKKSGAIPFDIPDVEFTHYKNECTFDYFIKKYKIKDSAVLSMAPIVRGQLTGYFFKLGGCGGNYGLGYCNCNPEYKRYADFPDRTGQFTRSYL